LCHSLVLYLLIEQIVTLQGSIVTKVADNLGRQKYRYYTSQI
jgi:hypothetical protein